MTEEDSSLRPVLNEAKRETNAVEEIFEEETGADYADVDFDDQVTQVTLTFVDSLV